MFNLGLWVNWGTLCSGEEEKNEEEEDDGDEDQLNRELLIINRHSEKCPEENSPTHSLSNVSLYFCFTWFHLNSQFDSFLLFFGINSWFSFILLLKWVWLWFVFVDNKISENKNVLGELASDIWSVWDYITIHMVNHD